MTTRRPLYQALATKVMARMNCANGKNPEWFQRHKDAVDYMVEECMPHGGGFDCGTTLDWDKSTGDKLVFKCAFHHMNDGGMYDGWSHHDVIVRPSLAFGFDLKITGRDRRDIKDYIADTFHHALREIEPEVPAQEAA